MVRCIIVGTQVVGAPMERLPFLRKPLKAVEIVGAVEELLACGWLLDLEYARCRSSRTGAVMPRKPNYSLERSERARLKQAERDAKVRQQQENTARRKARAEESAAAGSGIAVGTKSDC